MQVRGSLTQLALVRRAAGPLHWPLQAACLVVVEVPQPTAGLDWVRRQADYFRGPILVLKDLVELRVIVHIRVMILKPNVQV